MKTNKIILENHHNMSIPIPSQSSFLYWFNIITTAQEIEDPLRLVTFKVTIRHVQDEEKCKLRYILT